MTTIQNEKEMLRLRIVDEIKELEMLIADLEKKKKSLKNICN
jgi:hypothetical protein